MQGGSFRVSAASGFVLLLGLVTGCGDSQDKGGYEASCARNCERVHQCSSSIDIEQCTQSCESDWADVGPHLRQDYLAGIDQCVAELNCPELVVRAAATDRCTRQARSEVTASSTATQLCTEVDKSIQECLGASLGTAGCIEAVKILTDVSLLSASPCFNEPCDLRARCLSDTIGVALFGN